MYSDEVVVNNGCRCSFHLLMTSRTDSFSHVRSDGSDEGPVPGQTNSHEIGTVSGTKQIKCIKNQKAPLPSLDDSIFC